MATKKKHKKEIGIKYLNKVDPNLKDFGHHPFFVKKAEEGKAFLRKNGVPEEWAPIEEL
jgi:hypothetical protein